MAADDRLRRETEALIEAIWGPRPDPPSPNVEIDAARREQQNIALSVAMRAYLQQYLAEP